MGLVATELDSTALQGSSSTVNSTQPGGRGFVPGVSASRAQVLLHEAVFEALLSNALRNPGREGKGVVHNQQV